MIFYDFFFNFWKLLLDEQINYSFPIEYYGIIKIKFHQFLAFFFLFFFHRLHLNYSRNSDHRND